MTAAILQRNRFLVPLAAAGSLLFGALLAREPIQAVALVYLTAVVALAFLAPVVHLSLLVALTTIVPYSLQNDLTGGTSLLPSDVFLLTGLARAAIVLPQTQLEARRQLTIGLVLAFVVFALLAAYTGVEAGRAISDVGSELRTLLGFAVALIAMVVLLREDAAQRLMRALVVLGLLLGLWGVFQWAVGISFSSASDFGVREGVSFTSAGRGQVQGGLFAFPVAVIVSAAALISGQLRSRRALWATWGVVALNSIALLLTFERTFWVATVLALGVVVLRAGRARRARAVLWMVLIAAAGLVALSTTSPGTLVTARERLLSIGQYQSDSSLRYRRVESQHVLAQIGYSPWIGSGLAATIWWGRPWELVPPRTYRYSHNGYLWLVWRIGIPGALILFALLGAAAFWRGPPRGGPLLAAVRAGAQASLLALLLASVTFPAFNGYGITSTMGLLVGLGALPRARPDG